MTPPPTIPFSSIIFGSRARTLYDGITELAESIRLRGNVTPIGLHPLPDGTFLLVHGGRRYRAMESLGITELDFGIFAVPGRGGYVIASPDSNESDDIMCELIENLHRESLDWRDELRLLVKGWRHEKRKADLNNDTLTFTTYAHIIGVPAADIKAANRVHDDLIANPERYKDCTTLLMAYRFTFCDVLKTLEAGMANNITTNGRDNKPDTNSTEEANKTAATVESETASPVVISLTSRFRLGNSLDYLETERPQFDHIICDPDFAISKERLDVGVNNVPGKMETGIAQKSIEGSLADLQRFLHCAFNSVRNYCIFFYDLDHHEKCQQMAIVAGFKVQRWPIVWIKPGHQSNAAPQHNFTKNVEWAMVCRKDGATLATPGPATAIVLPKGNVEATFGHPFAKPIDLWTRIYSAVCRPGQTTFDPFGGAMSSVVAAIRFGLQPSAMELQEQHFNRGLLNVQEEYKRQVPGVRFE